ncbi:hypothetical protein [Ruminococcus flavefaciens]|uniref:hypothetical protein n=1 Tax=Ruminococcus flavefaciens TaxID=1265 RepID=UPI0013DB5976|nr:hypothetical protein [Ruminococcus flavefaciens]
MPFCTQCGRPLAEGETCSCRNNSANITPPPPQSQYNGYGYQPYQQGYPQAPYGYGQPYPPYGQPPYAQQKKSNGWIVGLAIGIVLLFALIGAAILVPAMLGYTRKAKLANIRSEANVLRKAAETSMIEIDEEGSNVKGRYIISSDKKDNVAVPFDIDDFNARLDRYFEDTEKYKYFIVVNNGYVEYAALSESWTKKTERIGTWPVGTDDKPREYSKDGHSEFSDKKTNLDTLYWKAYDEIFG